MNRAKQVRNSLFIITRLNYDQRTIDLNKKYSLPVSRKDNEERQILFEEGRGGGNGFHEGMNFLSYTNRIFIYLKPSKNRPSIRSLNRLGVPNGRICLITVARNPDTGKDFIVGVQANLRLTDDGLVRPDHTLHKGMEKIEFHAEGPADCSTLTGEFVETNLAPSRGYKYLTSADASKIFIDLLSSVEVAEQPKSVRMLEKIYKSYFNRTPKIKLAQARKKVGTSKSHGTAGEDFEYLSSRKMIRVTAKHRVIQEKFIKFLNKNGFEKIEENYYNVDVKAVKAGKVHFFEIKPTRETVECKEAIRYAIGQLYDYKFRLNQDAILSVVLGCAPSPEHKKFLKYVEVELYSYKQGEDIFE